MKLFVEPKSINTVTSVPCMMPEIFNVDGTMKPFKAWKEIHAVSSCVSGSEGRGVWLSMLVILGVSVDGVSRLSSSSASARRQRN